jgi:signal transduction histidine kinase
MSDPDTLADEALSRAENIVKSVHDLSHRLHPAKLRVIGVVAALRELEHEMTQAGLPVSFTHEDIPPALPPELTLCLFRIAQETMQNAMKYSHAHLVSVHLKGEQDGLCLSVTDDGIGFDVDTVWGKGLGLISMGERVEAVGGRFDLHSKPGAGTKIEVRVPLSAIKDADSVAV